MKYLVWGMEPRASSEFSSTVVRYSYSRVGEVRRSCSDTYLPATHFFTRSRKAATMTTRRLAPSRTIIASFAAEHPQQHAQQASAQPPLNQYDDGLYILHVASAAASTPISCALSDQSVQTYDQSTHALVHSIPRAHSGPITDLCHTTNEGTVVVTSGQDGYVRLFDLRQSAAAATSTNNSPSKGLSKAVAEMQLPRKEEALSVAIGYGGALAAVGGSRGLVHFFDLRSVGASDSTSASSSPNLLGTYEDAHTEEVTKVRFQPTPDLSGGTTNTLVTASEDGLVCTFDTSKPNEEEALSSVLNVGTPLRDVGFFGPNGEGLYCLTGSETMSVWHHDSAQRICDFGDVRSQLGSSAGMNIDYLVACNWDGNALSLLAGNSDGGAAIYRVDAGSIALTHTLATGHKGCVRGFVVRRQRHWITGGEDARLCEWNLDGPQAAASPAASSPPRAKTTAISPSQRRGGPIKHTRKKNSNAPY